MRGITAKFEMTEELQSLQAMHSTTKGEDLFEQVILAMNKFELPFEKLSGLATDAWQAKWTNCIGQKRNESSQS